MIDILYFSLFYDDEIWKQLGWARVVLVGLLISIVLLLNSVKLYHWHTESVFQGYLPWRE
jgi:hypothetical protein